MPAKITLTIIKGQLKRKQFLFDSRTICIIGRARNCNILIPNDEYHSTISRYHCLLDINPPDIRVRDFGSRNGTDVNGICIGKRTTSQTPFEGAKLNLSEYDLQDGDIIKLGTTLFQVTIEPELNISSPPITIQTKDKSFFMKGYKKIQKIGVGGFGEVYLARHNQTGKLVAIKTLLPQVAVKPYMKELFFREVKNMKKLNHPNLVELKDYCFSDGVFFFAMEYCDRGSVNDLIQSRKGRLSIEEVTNIILQILDGVHYAHTNKGLVHRDIKPSNIFLTFTDGKLVAKLGDYGLAKAFDLAGLSGQTMTGTAMGTPSYMSRKQVLDFKYAQPDVDVWAIAASLYFMLTLKYPRDFQGMDPMLAILRTQPIPIHQREASISHTLADLIDFALEDKSQLNFQTALEFKQALLQVMQNVTYTTLNVL